MFFSLWVLLTFVQCILIISTCYYLSPTPPSALEPISLSTSWSLLIIFTNKHKFNQFCPYALWVCDHPLHQEQLTRGHVPKAVTLPSSAVTGACLRSSDSRWSPPPTVHPVILSLAGWCYRSLRKTPLKKENFLLTPVSSLGRRPAAALLWAYNRWNVPAPGIWGRGYSIRGSQETGSRTGRDHRQETLERHTEGTYAPPTTSQLCL